MSRTRTDQAIVLRAWSVGETDRFCVLLTREHGRIAVRVPGARRLLSRRGRGLLPLHVADVTWVERDSVHTVTAASCSEPNPTAWQSIEALTAAEKGIQLVLSLTEDHAPVEQVYTLTEEFLRLCSSGADGVLTLFTIKLLSLLGNFPSATHSVSTGQRFGTDEIVVWSSASQGFVSQTEEPYGLVLSDAVRVLLSSLDQASLSEALTLDIDDRRILRTIVDRYSPIQLGDSFAFAGAPPARAGNSAAVTPTW